MHPPDYRVPREQVGRLERRSGARGRGSEPAGQLSGADSPEDQGEQGPAAAQPGPRHTTQERSLFAEQAHGDVR